MASGYHVGAAPTWKNVKNGKSDKQSLGQVRGNKVQIMQPGDGVRLCRVWSTCDMRPVCDWWGNIRELPTCGDSDLTYIYFFAFWTCKNGKNKNVTLCYLCFRSITANKAPSPPHHTIDWREMSSVELKKLVFRGVAGLRGEILTAYLNSRWLYGCEVPGRFLRAAVVGPQEAAYSQQCVFSGTCEQTSSSCSKAAVKQLAVIEQLGCHSDSQQTKGICFGFFWGGE